MKTRAHSCRELHSSIPQLCSRLMMPISVAWSCTGAPEHRVDGLGDHLDVLRFLEHAGRHRAGHRDLELHSRHVFDSHPRRSRPVLATIPPHGGGRIIRTGWEPGPEPMSGRPLPGGGLGALPGSSLGGAPGLRGVVSAAEQENRRGVTRCRACSVAAAPPAVPAGFVHRLRLLTAAADRGCCRSGDPGQRRSRVSARRGAAAGRWRGWRWTRPTTTCRRSGSMCWARRRSVTRFPLTARCGR